MILTDISDIYSKQPEIMITIKILEVWSPHHFCDYRHEDTVKNTTIFNVAFWPI